MQLFFHMLVFVSFYFFVEWAGIFEMQGERPDRKCLLILISLPIWPDFKKIMYRIYIQYVGI